MSNTMQKWLQDFVYRPGFLDHYPCYAYILAKMNPIESVSVEIMGISIQNSHFFLHVNVDFFIQQPQFLKGVLLHEVHHAVLGHLTHSKFRGAAHPDLMELAMEISANEYIQEPLPGTPLTWNNYKDFGLRPGQSTLRRYQLLAEARTEGWYPHVLLLLSTDSHLRPGVQSIYQPFEVPDSEGDYRISEMISEAANEAINRCTTERTGDKNGQNQKCPDKSSMLLAGKKPGQWLEELIGSKEDEIGFMDWKTAIQMFVALARAPVHTYSRPSRRFPEMVGMIPGRMYYPSKIEAPRLIVAIDTSASMTTEELSEVADQLIALGRVARIKIVECDVVIHRVYDFDEQVQSVIGRGGTDLRPVFEPDFLREHRPDGIIYFTDGFGPYPEQDPGIKTLWILSKPYEFNCAWGQKAFMPRKPDSASLQKKSVDYFDL